MAADGQCIEHGLRGVGMAAIPGIKDGYGVVNALRDVVGRAAVGMTNDKQIGLHRLQVMQHVGEAFPFHAGGADIHVQNVRREPFGSELEGGARSRAGLEEQVDDGAATQQRDLLHRFVDDAGE
jgi:hypothetical protein